MALKEFWLLPHRARTSVKQPYAPSLALRFGAAWNLHIEHGRHQPPVNLGGQVLGHDISHLTRRVNVLDVENSVTSSRRAFSGMSLCFTLEWAHGLSTHLIVHLLSS